MDLDLISNPPSKLDILFHKGGEKQNVHRFLF